MIYPTVIGLAALLVSFVVLRDWRNDPRLISACLVIAWLGGMTVATPMYHPYPRLVLPWLCAIWICLGMGMQWIEESQGTNLVVRFLRGKLSLFTAILAVIMFGRSATGLAQTWQDRADLQRVAAKIAETVREESAKRGTPANESIVYVFGEPGLVFGLKSLGFPLVGPAQNLQFASQPAVRPTFIAVPDTAGALSESDRLALSQPPFERVLSESFQKSHLVQNDDVSSTSRRGRIALYQLAK